jgi:hypothetical protein
VNDIAKSAVSVLRKIAVCALVFCFARAGFAQTGAHSENHLIVPGERIGALKLGARTADVDSPLGEPDFSDAATGKASETWFVGVKRGDKGRPFHRPDEIALFCHRDTEGHHYLITEIAVTSPRFATADGIAPGSALAAIRSKFPQIKQLEADPNADYWPPFGEIEFYLDTKQGIGFAIRKSDGVCVQILVAPSGEDYFRRLKPAVTMDYGIEPTGGNVGDLKLGMTGAELTRLLGAPAAKREIGFGFLWRWRLPAQNKNEPPAISIHFQKLPNGNLVANYIRLSSPFFRFTNKIFPGCPLRDVLQATGSTQWLDSYAPKNGETIDVYGDLHAGLTFEVRRSDAVCTAIGLAPPALSIIKNVGAWSQ